MFEQDSFGAGVVPGGLRSREEIKLLVSYILGKLDTELSRMLLCDILLEDGIANYFEINQAVTEMINSGVLLCKLDDDGEEVLSLMGSAYFEIGDIEGLIPRTVREKALISAKKLINRERIERLSEITVTEAEGGYLVNFEIGDSGEALFKLSVFVTDLAQLENAKRNFCDRAADIYSAVTAILEI